MKKFLLVFFLLLLTSQTVAAKTFKEQSAFKLLKEKILLNEGAQAWQDALLLEAEYLGDVDFDLLYGLAALKVQENERAVYAFERVVANEPSWLNAQYYLASAYFSMKNYHAVIELTESLKSNESIAQNLKSSTINLQRVAQASLNKQSLYIQQSVDINLGYDSNINAGSSEDNIFLPSLNQSIVLSEDSQKNSSSFLALGHQLIGVKALTQSSKLAFSAVSKLHSFNSSSDFNRFSIRTNLRYKKDFEAFSGAVGLKVVPLWLDDRYYRTQFGATFGLSKNFNKHWLFSSEAFVGKTKNDVVQQLNTDDSSVQMSLQYSEKNWLHLLSLSHLKEDSEFVENQHVNRKISAVNYTANFAIDRHWLASANLSYQHQAYQHIQRFFLEKRTDNMWLFGASIQYQDTDNWSYRLSATVQDKDSNLVLYSYERADINFSARMSF